MRNRSGSSPKRRIVVAGSVPKERLKELLQRARYVGSGHHKRSPADYGFERTNPRPTKSLCDANRVIALEEAKELLRIGILSEMMSLPPDGGFPKFVWSVSQSGEVFEAKTHPNTPGMYHGYPLESEDDMRERVLKIWKDRCEKPGR
jgi:hypothetical protein